MLLFKKCQAVWIVLTVSTVNSVKSVNSVVSVDTVKSVKSVDSVDSIDSVNSVNSASSVWRGATLISDETHSKWTDDVAARSAQKRTPGRDWTVRERYCKNTLTH